MSGYVFSAIIGEIQDANTFFFAQPDQYGMSY